MFGFGFDLVPADPQIEPGYLTNRCCSQLGGNLRPGRDCTGLHRLERPGLLP